MPKMEELKAQLSFIPLESEIDAARWAISEGITVEKVAELMNQRYRENRTFSLSWLHTAMNLKEV